MKTEIVGIWDFDRVLFDTDAFIARLNAEGLGDMDRGQELLDAIEEKDIDWGEYVNKDAVRFLQETSDTCYIVSSFFSRNRGDNASDPGQLEFFQKEKIRRSGLSSVVSDRMITTDKDKKGEFMGILRGHPDALTYVVDDEKENLEPIEEYTVKSFYFKTMKNAGVSSTEGAPAQSHEIMTESFNSFLHEREEWVAELETDVK